MNDVIIFTTDVKTNKKVVKSFMLMLKKYGMLLKMNKVHTYRSKEKYMNCCFLAKTFYPLSHPWDLMWNLSPPYQYLVTARGIKSFIGCVIHLAQFLPKLSELIKPINDILKNCNKVNPADKIKHLPLYAKGKGKGKKLSPNLQKYWMPIHTNNFEA